MSNPTLEIDSSNTPRYTLRRLKKGKFKISSRSGSEPVKRVHFANLHPSVLNGYSLAPAKDYASRLTQLSPSSSRSATTLTRQPTRRSLRRVMMMSNEQVMSDSDEEHPVNIQPVDLSHKISFEDQQKSQNRPAYRNLSDLEDQQKLLPGPTILRYPVSPMSDRSSPSICLTIDSIDGMTSEKEQFLNQQQSVEQIEAADLRKNSESFVKSRSSTQKQINQGSTEQQTADASIRQVGLQNVQQQQQPKNTKTPPQSQQHLPKKPNLVPKRASRPIQPIQNLNERLPRQQQTVKQQQHQTQSSADQPQQQPSAFGSQFAAPSTDFLPSNTTPGSDLPSGSSSNRRDNSPPHSQLRASVVTINSQDSSESEESDTYQGQQNELRRLQMLMRSPVNSIDLSVSEDPLEKKSRVIFHRSLSSEPAPTNIAGMVPWTQLMQQRSSKSPNLGATARGSSREGNFSSPILSLTSLPGRGLFLSPPTHAQLLSSGGHNLEDSPAVELNSPQYSVQSCVISPKVQQTVETNSTTTHKIGSTSSLTLAQDQSNLNRFLSNIVIKNEPTQIQMQQIVSPGAGLLTLTQKRPATHVEHSMSPLKQMRILRLEELEAASAMSSIPSPSAAQHSPSTVTHASPSTSPPIVTRNIKSPLSPARVSVLKQAMAPSQPQVDFPVFSIGALSTSASPTSMADTAASRNFVLEPMIEAVRSILQHLLTSQRSLQRTSGQEAVAYLRLEGHQRPATSGSTATPLTSFQAVSWARSSLDNVENEDN